LLNDITNSWEKTICHNALLGDVATLFGVAQNQRVHGNVSLTYFEIQTQVSTKPLRWQDILALMKVILSYKMGHVNAMPYTLSRRQECKAMSTVQILWLMFTIE